MVTSITSSRPHLHGLFSFGLAICAFHGGANGCASHDCGPGNRWDECACAPDDADTDADSDVDTDSDADVETGRGCQIDSGVVLECPEGKKPGDAAFEMDIEFRFACAGTFTMGDEKGYHTEPHQVNLTKSFWIGTYEVTQGQFEEVMGYQPSAFEGCADCPAERLSWHEAAAFANALSDAALLDPCYECEGSGRYVECIPVGFGQSPYDYCPGYRLPTEAEWEYAARAGEDWCYSGSDDPDEVAWYHGNSGGETHPVGLLTPNAWGIHDMSGNVSESCHDWYRDWFGDGDVPTEETDPAGPEEGTERVHRGGTWGYLVTVTHRMSSNPAAIDFSHGFRIARTAS